MKTFHQVIFLPAAPPKHAKFRKQNKTKKIEGSSKILILMFSRCCSTLGLMLFTIKRNKACLQHQKPVKQVPLIWQHFSLQNKIGG